MFTAVSAVTVTGLAVVDTPTYWSGFGEAVILALIQVGGIGIITSATLFGLLISRRIGLGWQLSAQAESRSLGLGEVRQVVGGVNGAESGGRSAGRGAAGGGGAVRGTRRRAGGTGPISGRFHGLSPRATTPVSRCSPRT